MKSLVAALLLLSTPALPRSSVAVAGADGAWHAWWNAGAAPKRWSRRLDVVTSAVRWHAAAPGVEWGELSLAGSGVAWRTRVVVLRLDPARVRLAVTGARRDDGRGAWTIDSIPRGAIAAFNAGQFDEYDPWGWIVRDGVEQQPPRTGPLSAAFTVDATGRARLVSADGIDSVRREGAVVTAIQSYPVLLTGDGEVPAALQASGRGVDVEHRDARLAIGITRDGHVLVALSRFDALGDAFGAVPVGPTIPEMAALMGALGCRGAMALDGGISGQLVLRGGNQRHEWRGIRRVPVALAAFPR